METFVNPPVLPPNPIAQDMIRRKQQRSDAFGMQGRSKFPMWFTGGVVLALALGYSKSPTGRHRFIFSTPGFEDRMARSRFKSTIAGEVVIDHGPRVARVARVMRPILRAAKIEDCRIVVVDSPQLNAWVLPGPRVCVYSGLLDVVGNAELGFILAHELGHALSRHMGENLGRTVMMFIASVAMGVGVPSGLTNTFSQAMEYEADEIGTNLIAKACVSPHVGMRALRAIDERGADQDSSSKSWSEKMAAQFSTHPPTDLRIARIKENLPAALEIMKESRCRNTRAVTDSLVERDLLDPMLVR